MDTRPPHPKTAPPRRPALVVGALALAVGGVSILFHALPHASGPARDNGGYIVVGSLNDFRQHPEPQFAAAPTPTGDVSLKDLCLQPLEILGPLRVAGLTVLCQGGGVVIKETASGRTVWSGPFASASFSLVTDRGTHTLKDGAWRNIWTDTARVGPPDLTFHRTPDGQGLLTGRSGVTLWAGRLPPAVPGPAMIHGSADNPFEADGIHVMRAGGAFRVTDDDGRLLWSGPLPARPTIVARSGGTFLYSGPHGIESGPEGLGLLDFEAAAGDLTVADAHRRTLGRLPLHLVSLRETMWRVDSPEPFTTLTPCGTPDGSLTAVGTLLLTYRDAGGRVVRRSKVFRAADGRTGRLG